MQMRKDYVLVQDITGSETSESGLVLPNSCKEKNRARVIMVGPDVSEGLEAGQTVVINMGGLETEIDGKKHRVVKDEHVIMVL